MSVLSRSLCSLAGAALLSPVLLGCADDPTFEHLSFRRVSSAPGLATLRPREIDIEQGIAVKARVSAIGSDGEAMDLLELQSSDSRIFRVDLGPSLGEFVFYGVSRGTAELDVFTNNGVFRASLPVTVFAQDEI